MVWGAIAGAVTSAFGQHKANQDSFEHSEKMYRNRYQWQVEDMRKAGLNPILSVTGGGLSAPSVSTPQAQSVTKDIAPLMELAVNSAIAQQNADTEKAKAETDAIRADTEFKEYKLAESRYSNLELPVAKAQTAKMEAETSDIKTMSPVNAAKAKAETDKLYNDIYNNTRHIDSLVRNLDSYSAVNSAMIGKIAAETSKVIEETVGVKLDNKVIERDLNDVVAKAKRDGASNPLGYVGNYLSGMFGGYTGVLPSRIGIGFSKK